MTKVFKSLFWALFLTLILLGVPKLAGVIADAFDYTSIDPDGAYAWLFVHHIAQAGIFCLAILVISRFKHISFNLGWGNVEVGKKYVLRFTLYFSMYLVGTLAFTVMAGSFQLFTFPMTARNIIGYLSFQLLLSGPSEELIFRAFATTMLALVLKSRVFGGKASLANVIAALIFGLAHVGFSFAPFQVSYSVMQVVYAMVLGLFYGDCYEKSGSVIYPMMMHSISNVLSVGATVIITALLQ